MKKAIAVLVDNYDFDSEEDFYSELSYDRKQVIDWLRWRAAGGRMDGEIITKDLPQAAEKILQEVEK